MVLIILKPDSFKRNIWSDIIEDIGKEGFYIEETLFLEKPCSDLIREHYIEHKEKPFYDELVNFLAQGPLMTVKISKRSSDEIKEAREMTKKLREKYNATKMENLIHCSDSAESAKREIKLFFKK